MGNYVINIDYYEHQELAGKVMHTNCRIGAVTSLGIAEHNLQKIAKHYEEGRCYEQEEPEYLKLLNDNNTITVVQTFWLGRFKKLLKAEIVIDTPNLGLTYIPSWLLYS